jgi:hypothetical protein
MSTSITERPEQYCHSKNEIRYQFLSTDLTPLRQYIEVELWAKNVGDADFAKIKTFNLKPNPDGITYVYLEGYIDSLLKWVLPVVNTTFTAANKQVAQFYIRYREVSATTPSPSWISSEDAHIRTALKGGIEKQKWSRNNFFLWQQNAKAFFTWEPKDRYIFQNQLAFISCFIRTTGTYKLRVSIKKIGVTDPVVVDTNCAFTAGVFYHLNIGYTQLGIGAAAGGDPVHYYEVSIINPSNTIEFAAIRMNVEQRPLYEYYDMIFHNSLGGVSTQRVRGELTIGFEKEVQDMDGSLSNQNFDATVKAAENITQSIKKDTYKGDLGFFATKAHQDSCQDLLLSSSIYQWMDSRMVPVINLQKNVAFRKTTDKIFSLPIEWQLAFNNAVYTPSKVQLGIGTNTETY